MKYAICGNYGVGNLGDEIILINLKRFLREIDPQAEFSIMGKGMHLPFFSIGSFLKSLIFLQRFLRPIRAIFSCDHFILGGGGLFDDTEKQHLSAFWAAQGIVACIFGKPVYLIGVSGGRMSRWSRFILRQLLKRASLILVRDENTQKIFDSLGGNTKVGSDLATLYSENFGSAATLPLEINEKYILICFRDFINFDEKLYKKIAQAIDITIKNFGLKIIFLPFASGRYLDVQVSNKIFAQMDQKSNAQIREYTDDISKIYHLISNAELVISMRLHPGILGGSLGVPVIPISYMDKVDSFWESFSIKPVTLDEKVGNSLLEAITLFFQNVREHRTLAQNIKRRIHEKASFTRQMLEDNLINTIK